jgi:hypothetical protein
MAEWCQQADCDRGASVVCERCKQPFCAAHARSAWDMAAGVVYVVCVGCFAAAAPAVGRRPRIPTRRRRHRTTPG